MLDRNLPDTTTQCIGETNDSRRLFKGMIAALNVSKTRIDILFADQRAAADYWKFKGLAAISTAMKMSQTNTPRRTQGHFLVYWDDCSKDLQDSWHAHGRPMPDERPSANSIQMNVTDISGVTKMYSSVAAVQKALRISRATIFDAAKNGHHLRSGHKIEIFEAHPRLVVDN